MSDWLFAESYDAVGDVAETVALAACPTPERSSDLPLDRVGGKAALAAPETRAKCVQKAAMLEAWSSMDRNPALCLEQADQRELPRRGFAAACHSRALAKVSGIDAAIVAHRLMGDWEPNPTFYEQLECSGRPTDADHSRPYPFCLAHGLEGPPDALGPIVHDWQAEWKWDGIRAQLIRRGGDTFLWTRGEELVTERYPELANPGRLSCPKGPPWMARFCPGKTARRSRSPSFSGGSAGRPWARRS